MTRKISESNSLIGPRRVSTAIINLFYPQIPKKSIIEKIPSDSPLIEIIDSANSIIRCTNVETMYCLHTGLEDFEEYKLPDSKLFIRVFKEDPLDRQLTQSAAIIAEGLVYIQLYYSGDVCLYSFKMNHSLPIMAQLNSLMFQYFSSGCYVERTYNQLLAVVIRDNLYYPEISETFCREIINGLEKSETYDSHEVFGVVAECMKHYEGLNGRKIAAFNITKRDIPDDEVDLILKLKEDPFVDRKWRILKIVNSEGVEKETTWVWNDYYLTRNKKKADEMFDRLMFKLNKKIKEELKLESEEIKKEIEFPYEVLIIIDSIIEESKK